MSTLSKRELVAAVMRLHNLAMNNCMACVSEAQQSAAGEILRITQPIIEKITQIEDQPA